MKTADRAYVYLAQRGIEGNVIDDGKGGIDIIGWEHLTSAQRRRLKKKWHRQMKRVAR